MSRNVLIVVSLTCCLFANEILLGQVSNNSLGRFISEAPDAWNDFSKTFKKFQQFEIEEIESGEGVVQGQQVQMNLRRNNKVLLKGEKFLSKISQTAEDGMAPPAHVAEQFGRVKLRACNGIYWFSLTGKESDWSLETVEDLPEGKSLPGAPNVFSILGSGVTMDHQSFASLIDPDLYQALDAREVADGCVEVKFSSKFDADSNRGTVKLLTAVFDPDFFWLPIEAKLDLSIAGVVHEGDFSWEYPDNFNAESARILVKKEIKRPNGNGMVIRKINAHASPVNDNQFFLSFYGLPEPKTTKTGIGYYLLPIVVLALLSGIVMFRRSKRSF